MSSSAPLKVNLSDIEPDEPTGSARQRILDRAASYGLGVSSATRTPAKNRAVGGAKNSYHLPSSNRSAYDFTGTPKQLGKFAKEASKEGGAAEVFFDPVGGFKKGKSIGAVGKHSDHAHVAFDEPDNDLRVSLGDIEPDEAPSAAAQVAELLTDRDAKKPLAGQSLSPQPTVRLGGQTVPADLPKHLAPRESINIQATDGKPSLTASDESDLYREWYNARREGRTADALELGRNYEQLFPTGKNWKTIYDENKRLGRQDEKTTKAKGGGIDVPVDYIKQAREAGKGDDEILSAVRDALTERLGLAPGQVAYLTEKWGKHPLGRLTNEATGQPLTVDDILTAEKNGLFSFRVPPELLAAIEKEKTPAESKEGMGAFAANAGRASASLPAAIPRTAAMITAGLGSDPKEGLSGDLLRVGDAIQNSLQPEYLREQAADSADTWSGKFGSGVGSLVNALAGGAAMNTSKAFSNVKNFLPDKGVLSRFSPQAAAFGALQGGGQAFDEAVKAGATREQALANGILNTLISLSEGVGIEGIADNVALKRYAANKAKEAVIGFGENFTQETFQGVASDAAKQLTYDPKTKTFSVENLIKNLKSGAIGGVLGAGGGILGSTAQRSDVSIPEIEQQTSPQEQIINKQPLPPPREVQAPIAEITPPPAPIPSPVETQPVDAAQDQAAVEYQTERNALLERTKQRKAAEAAKTDNRNAPVIPRDEAAEAALLGIPEGGGELAEQTKADESIVRARQAEQRELERQSLTQSPTRSATYQGKPVEVREFQLDGKPFVLIEGYLDAIPADQVKFEAEAKAAVEPVTVPDPVAERSVTEAKAPVTVKNAKPKVDENSSLSQIIRSSGGLKTGKLAGKSLQAGRVGKPLRSVESGELDWLRESSMGKQPGFFSNKGLTLDGMRETVNQYGFEFETVSDLLKALDEEARGNKQHSVQKDYTAEIAKVDEQSKVFYDKMDDATKADHAKHLEAEANADLMKALAEVQQEGMSDELRNHIENIGIYELDFTRSHINDLIARADAVYQKSNAGNLAEEASRPPAVPESQASQRQGDVGEKFKAALIEKRQSGGSDVLSERYKKDFPSEKEAYEFTIDGQDYSAKRIKTSNRGQMGMPTVNEWRIGKGKLLGVTYQQPEIIAVIPHDEISGTQDVDLIRRANQSSESPQLTTTQTDRVKELHKTLKEQGTTVDDYLNQQGMFGDELNPQQQELLRELSKQTEKAPVKEKQPRLISEEAYRNAEKRLGGGGLKTGIDPEDIKSLAIIAAYHIESGARNFADFSKRMLDDLAEFAEDIKPHLQKLWDDYQAKKGTAETPHHSTTQPRDESTKQFVKAEEKERSLPKTLEAHDLPKGDDLIYEVVENDRSVRVAKENIATKGVDGAAEFVRSSSDPSAEVTATGVAAIAEYQKQAQKATDKTEKASLFEKANNLASDLAEKLTSAGQAIQAVKVIGKFSPERALITAQKLAEKANRKVSTLRAEQITDAATKIQQAETRIRELESVIADFEAKTKAKDQSRRAKVIKELDAREAEARTRLASLNIKPREVASTPAQRGAIGGTRADAQTISDFASVMAAKVARGDKDLGDIRAELSQEFGSLFDVNSRAVEKEANKVLMEANRQPKTAKTTPREQLKKSVSEAEKWDAGIKENAKANPDDMDAVAPSLLANVRETGAGRMAWEKEMATKFGDAFNKNKNAIYTRAFEAMREAQQSHKELGAIKRAIKEGAATDEQIKAIRKKLDAERKAHLQASLGLARHYDSLVGGRKLRIISGVRKAGLLSSVRTHLRNFVSNTAYQVFDEVSRIPAVVTDFATSTVTGQRGITGASPSASLDSVVAAFKVGGKEAIDIMKHGQTAEEAMKLQLPQELNSGSKIIDLAANTVFRAMAASDRVFYNGALKRNLIDRAKVQALNEVREGKIKYRDASSRTKELVKTPSDELSDNAKHDALVATFNNNNKLSDGIRLFRSKLSPSANFAIDLVMPFDRTPTNVVARVLEASPVGFAKPTKILAKSLINKSMSVEEQRQFSQSMGRATTGTALVTLGWVLGAKGLMSALYDDDEGWDTRRENRKLKEQGESPMAIKVGNQWVTVGDTNIGNLLAIGATLQKEMSEGKTLSDKAIAIPSTAGKVFLEQPLAGSAKDVVKAVGDPKGKGADYTGRLLSSFIPAAGMVRDVATAADSKARKTFGFTGKVFSSVPGLRNALPEDVGIQHRRTWAVDPFRMTTDKGKSSGSSVAEKF